MTEPIATGSYPGIEIAYHESPYRHYLVNGEQVPSVTTVLGVLNKAALPNWAAKVTREGCWQLIRKDRTTRYLRRKWGENFTTIIAAIEGGETQSSVVERFGVERRDYLSATASLGFLLPRNMYEFADALKAHGLTHTQTTKAAADRGVDVHAVWEDWHLHGKIPNAAEYPKDRRPYLRAMAKFIMDHSPQALETEQVVGSAVHKFAGRLDTVVVLSVAGKGRCMIDVKTSKRVYPNSHFPQLRGYEIARRECGLDPSDDQGILRLGDNGEYELAWASDPKHGGPTTDDDFLSVLATWRSQQKWSSKRD